MSLNDKLASLARRLLAEKARRTQTIYPPSLEPEESEETIIVRIPRNTQTSSPPRLEPEPEEIIILRLPIYNAAQLLRIYDPA